MTEPVRTLWTSRLGIVAGGGRLPVEIAGAVADSKPFVIRVSGFCDDDFDGFEQIELSVGQVGTMIKAAKKAGCDALCFAGYITRPNLKDIKLDARGLIMVPKALAAGRQGDDAAIRVVLDEFESAGFTILGAEQVMAPLKPEEGVLGAHAPDAEMQADVDKAVATARDIGAMDIGQGAVSCRGLILAVEAQEGTNAMLERVAGLPEQMRGHSGARAGVLAKVPKPIQERRADLPTIGMDTVRRCVDAGLAGIVLEAGGGLIVSRSEVIEALDEAGLFLMAVPGLAEA